MSFKVGDRVRCKTKVHLILGEIRQIDHSRDSYPIQVRWENVAPYGGDWYEPTELILLEDPNDLLKEIL